MTAMALALASTSSIVWIFRFSFLEVLEVLEVLAVLVEVKVLAAFSFLEVLEVLKVLAVSLPESGWWTTSTRSPRRWT